ncbi:hypothetical protein BDQ17DRAFT_1304835 [Cyathus striatus]|nr:hypothetical protein BDQ17DRAFT_1304835 [Cyathus striatus]
MRCNWQSLARCAQRTPVPSSYPTSARLSSAACPRRFRLLASSAPRYPTRTFFCSPTLKLLARVASKPPDSQTIPVPPLSFASEIPPLATPLTTPLSANRLSPAELSRCLSKLIRASIQENNIDNAFLLVKLVTKPSFRANILADHSSLSALFLQIDPDAKISARLVSHTLLHELIRHKYIAEAYQTAKGIMAEGIHLRSSSLQATIQTLAKVKMDKNTPTKLHIVDKVASVVLTPNSAAGLQTRAIIDLLNVAQRAKNRRTHAMFDMLLSLCLLNGEIIVASLIFGYIAKNWKAKESILAQSTDDFDSSPIAFEIGLESAQITKPSTLQLFVITRAINRVITQDGRGRKFDNNFYKAVQALANLAWLLDHRLIPHDDIAFLVRTMYACPKVNSNVWVLNADNQPEKVQAHRYLHAVLSRLISNLPAKAPEPPYVISPPRTSDGWEGGVMPPLNLNSYNALIHYALRHQLSPALASQILDHMATQREEPLKVDITTINIVLTSGKLMRRPDIVNQALGILKLNQITKWKNAMTRGSLSLLESSRHQYLSCLRSSGDPMAVVNQLFKILPGLRPSEIPTYKDLPKGDRFRQRKLHVRKALMRAAKLGPYVFTELLNCLLKAGKIDLMRWVFNWARKAEKWSWKDPTIKAWNLPIHAYTIMIEGYAVIIRRHWIAHSPNVDLRLHAITGTTRTKNTQKAFVARNLAQWVRSLMARQAQAIKNTSLALNELKREQLLKLLPPKPDARFYNALLAVHARSCGMRPRKAAARRSRCRQLLRHSIQRRREVQARPKLKDPVLLEILREMLGAGFAIPLGLRHLFVGILKPATLAFEGKRSMDRTPRAFPDAAAKSTKSLYSIPVPKTKGLSGW